MANSSLKRASLSKGYKNKEKTEMGSVPAKALIRERSKSLELEFPPSYSYSSTISCCSVGSQPPRTTEMSVVILSIGPTTHFYLTLRKGAPETKTIETFVGKTESIFIPLFYPVSSNSRIKRSIYTLSIRSHFSSTIEGWIVIFKNFL